MRPQFHLGRSQWLDGTEFQPGGSSERHHQAQRDRVPGNQHDRTGGADVEGTPDSRCQRMTRAVPLSLTVVDGHEPVPGRLAECGSNGHLPKRWILTETGAVEDRVSKPRNPFGSDRTVPIFDGAAATLPTSAWRERRFRPYLHGVSTGQIRPAVSALVGGGRARGRPMLDHRRM